MDVDAERATLPNQAVEQERRFLRDLVVLDEEFLELVDDEQDSRRRLAGGGAETGQVLRRRREIVRRALSIRRRAAGGRSRRTRARFRRRSPRVRQLVDRVGLKLDPFLEVDQVQLDLVRAVIKRQVCDQGVQEG